MHVGILVHSWLEDAEGGGNRVAHDLARFLERRGHRITVIVPALSSVAVGETGGNGLRILRYRWAGAHASGLSRWQSHVREISRTLRHCHRAAPFDVLHCHGVLQGVGVIASRLHVPFVQTVHAPVSLEAPYRRGAFDRLTPTRWTLHAGDAVLHRLEGIVLRAASSITCLSGFMLAELHRAHPWLKRAIERKATIVRGGTNLGAFATGMRKEEARAVLGWGREPVVVSVRRLEPRMGLDLLLDACLELARLDRPFRCVIAGRGSLEIDLKRRRRALGLEDCVELAGFVPERMLPCLYAAADVVVMPSVAAEGFGVSGIEALASGTPVVVTPVAANPEIAGSVDARFVASEPSGPAIAKAVIELAGMAWNRDELTRACVRRFDIDVVGPEYERVLGGAVAAGELVAARA
ncbi:MAG: glycosyltransferase family 4 protein [Vicinamibacterales bacterium]